jgi:Methane oxygenase PmoA
MLAVKPRALLVLATSCLIASCPSVRGQSPAGKVNLTQLADRVRVEIDGQHFTDYVFGDGASRSYCYPILATDGTPLTRNSPMKKVEGEEDDHPWQKSFWFAHSFVNGIDFWNEAGGDLGRSPKEKGHTRNDGAPQLTSGPVGTIKVKNRWLSPDEKLVATDERILRFHAVPEGRFIDFEITIHALPDQPLLMGDNKDGTMATRVAQWMTMPHTINAKDAEGKTVKKEVGGKGQIVTSTGFRGNEAWGKRAPWCDYNAEKDGKVYGIAIFDHPQNLRHPTWWMARNYGLFGANPFGWHDYEKEFANEPHKGDHTIPAGGSLTLRYRFFFHNGDEKAAKVEARYAEYAAGK